MSTTPIPCDAWATAYGIVKQSGGYIECRSEPGKGTSFTIYLPWVENPSAVIDRPMADANLSQGSETILLAEDSESLRELTRHFLVRLGYVVLEAGSGAEALLLAQQHKGTIDLLLTDVVMPGISGRDLAEKMAGLYPQLKVLYTSGYTNDAILRHGIEERTFFLLAKPFTLQGLARKLREVLNSDNGRTQTDRPGIRFPSRT